MKNKSASRSAFFNPRILISLVFCAIGVLLTLLAFAIYPGGNALAAPKQQQNQSGTRALVVRNSATEPDGRLTEGAAPPLGNYPDTSVALSGDTIVTPDVAPTNTTSINAVTNSNFKGTFVASPTTGVVTVTDAHPAGTYTVTVTAFGAGGTTTKIFTLTVTSTPCPGLTSGFTNAADLSVSVGPGSVAVGDFNGDGKQDLTVLHLFTSGGPFTVSIHLEDGLGGFSSAPAVPVGDCSSVAIGDFNGDGKQDLAMPCSNNGSPPSRSAWEMAWAALAAQLS